MMLMNKILWVDTVVSKGPATWSRDKLTQLEYDAMAHYQRNEVRALIHWILGVWTRSNRFYPQLGS